MAETLLYIQRGGRDFYDVTVEELQEACSIYDSFYGMMSEYLDSWYQRDDDEQRYEIPYMLSSYYETVGKIEQLRQKVVRRKLEESGGKPEYVTNV